MGNTGSNEAFCGPPRSDSTATSKDPSGESNRPSRVRATSVAKSSNSSTAMFERNRAEAERQRKLEEQLVARMQNQEAPVQRAAAPFRQTLQETEYEYIDNTTTYAPKHVRTPLEPFPTGKPLEQRTTRILGLAVDHDVDAYIPVHRGMEVKAAAPMRGPLQANQHQYAPTPVQDPLSFERQDKIWVPTQSKIERPDRTPKFAEQREPPKHTTQAPKLLAPPALWQGHESHKLVPHRPDPARVGPSTSNHITGVKPLEPMYQDQYKIRQYKTDPLKDMDSRRYIPAHADHIKITVPGQKRRFTWWEKTKMELTRPFVEPIDPLPQKGETISDYYNDVMDPQSAHVKTQRESDPMNPTEAKFYMTEKRKLSAYADLRNELNEWFFRDSTTDGASMRPQRVLANPDAIKPVEGVGDVLRNAYNIYSDDSMVHRQMLDPKMDKVREEKAFRMQNSEHTLYQEVMEDRWEGRSTHTEPPVTESEQPDGERKHHLYGDREKTDTWSQDFKTWFSHDRGTSSLPPPMEGIERPLNDREETILQGTVRELTSDYNTYRNWDKYEVKNTLGSNVEGEVSAARPHAPFNPSSGEEWKVWSQTSGTDARLRPVPQGHGQSREDQRTVSQASIVANAPDKKSWYQATKEELFDYRAPGMFSDSDARPFDVYVSSQGKQAAEGASILHPKDLNGNNDPMFGTSGEWRDRILGQDAPLDSRTGGSGYVQSHVQRPGDFRDPNYVEQAAWSEVHSRSETTGAKFYQDHYANNNQTGTYGETLRLESGTAAGVGA